MARMKAPPSGARIRMYRQGQGDCFLIAFPRSGASPDNPVYLLIDCGIMNGSEIRDDVDVATVIDNIHECTNGFIDYVVVTHEHADHVNGFNKKRGGKRIFEKIDVGQLWLAWTEDGDDAFANDLRDRFNDQLVALAEAEHRLRADTASGVRSQMVSQLLELEIGPEAERRTFRDAASTGPIPFAIDGITNKRAIKFLRDHAEAGPVFLRPGQTAFKIDGTEGALTFVLGPPRDETMLLSLDPVGDEEFHARHTLKLSGEAASFYAAMTKTPGAAGVSPFAPRFATLAKDVEHQGSREVDEGWSSDDARDRINAYHARTYYGTAGTRDETWRRIDSQWLEMAEPLALRLNHEVNNTSLVLAFELPESGKVLLFTGDAQRGNWLSWSTLSWERPDGGTTHASDLLGRCVFYKCGHHGSHNATLNGNVDSDYANLAWLGKDAPDDEFVAMVPVHSKWANEKQGWNHPLPAIVDALMKKARGRVLLNDVKRVKRPKASDGHGKLTDTEWTAFKDQSIEAKVYKEYIVLDE
ncbi:MAG: hypothetical protein AAF299_12045 [Pseudomonadota bacterium]